MGYADHSHSRAEFLTLEHRFLVDGKIVPDASTAKAHAATDWRVPWI